MSEEITEKIYVRMIDGIMSLVPVLTKQIQRNQYEILDSVEYSDIDDSVLFEFYPGDIVEVDDHDHRDDGYQFDAIKFIQPSNMSDRLYLEFKFRATFGAISISKETAIKYKHEIERIKNEIVSGKFFYRGIRETIKYLDRLEVK